MYIKHGFPCRKKSCLQHENEHVLTREYNVGNKTNLKNIDFDEQLFARALRKFRKNEEVLTQIAGNKNLSVSFAENFLAYVFTKEHRPTVLQTFLDNYPHPLTLQMFIILSHSNQEIRTTIAGKENIPQQIVNHFVENETNRSVLSSLLLNQKNVLTEEQCSKIYYSHPYKLDKNLIYDFFTNGNVSDKIKNKMFSEHFVDDKTVYVSEKLKHMIKTDELTVEILWNIYQYWSKKTILSTDFVVERLRKQEAFVEYKDYPNEWLEMLDENTFTLI